MPKKKTPPSNARSSAKASTSKKKTAPSKDRSRASAVKLKTAAKKQVGKPTERVDQAIELLKSKSTAHDLANLDRFGIVAPNALGVSMANMKGIAKQLGADHDLALGLWKSGAYEARMLATLVDVPAEVTQAQMNTWCRDFDNWAICDTACFCLFDRVDRAWESIQPWSRRKPEFEKRAAFALMASIALHNKSLPDDCFYDGFAMIEEASTDDRNFVKKGVNWALRAVGLRNTKLKQAAIAVSQRLVDSGDRTAMWIGRDALRQLTKSKKS